MSGKPKIKGQFTEIWVEVGMTVPTGDYANVRPMAGAKIVLPEDATKEDIEQAFDEAWERTVDTLNKRLEDMDNNE